MVGCQTFRKRFSTFLDGELSAKKQAALEDHLAVCAACRRELAAWQELGPILERLEVSAPPAGMAARITAEARRRGSDKSFGHLFRLWPAAILDWPWAVKALGTAAIFVLMFSFGLFVSTKGWLPGFSEHRTGVSTAAGSAAEGLEWFAPGPPGSLVSGYLAMAGQVGPAADKP